MLLRLLIVFAIVAPAIILLRSPASACECQVTDDWTPTDEMDQSERVFRGVVTSIGSLGVEEGDHEIEFAVATVWKGIASRNITVWTGLCGYSFEEGSEYVVYVYGPVDGERPGSVSMCSRTALVGDAGIDLAELGPGATIEYDGDPPTPYDPANRTPLSEKTWIIPIVAVLIASIVGFLWFIAKRLAPRLS